MKAIPSQGDSPIQSTAWFTEDNLNETRLLANYRADLRAPTPGEWDQFIERDPVRDWSLLSWKDIGRPFRVQNESEVKREWEDRNGPMTVKTSWKMFNQSFHSLFAKEIPSERNRMIREIRQNVGAGHWLHAWEILEDLFELSFWNYAHRVQDAIWDPRGKRALFQGLNVDKPRILFLGAADGYEAMQLSAMYPGGEAVLVDYDDFCRTHRFGEFPEAYPFLGSNPATGAPKVWYKRDMNLSFVVDDIRNLPFGNEFDIVISVGLVEHFPDEFKSEAIDFHRRFVKPNGYVIMTTPRLHWKTKLFYTIMAEAMNYTYRELMDVKHLGLYAYENGFDIVRHGVIKSHNGIISQVR